MAEAKKSKSKPASKKTTKTTETKQTSSSTSSKKNTRRSSGIRTWGLNKISFWCIGAMAILYLVASILALCGVNFKVVSVLKDCATALAICIVAVLAWRYVAPKQTVWKVLYIVLLLVVLLGIVLPLVV